MKPLNETNTPPDGGDGSGDTTPPDGDTDTDAE